MLLIKNGRVIDPSSKTDEILDILIDDEKIIKMDKNISALNSDMKIIDAADLVVVPGLIDVHSHFRDPGFTYKEDILSGSRAAARGGYTTVVCMANTNPVVDNEETLNYILNKAKDSKIEILQVASVTKGLNGTELVNMEKLKEAGAVGFSDWVAEKIQIDSIPSSLYFVITSGFAIYDTMQYIKPDVSTKIGRASCRERV